jgi:DNA helicase HerA-like ATPase
MGPLLLSRMMNLNETQEGVLNIAFRVADDNGMPILDLKDLRAMLAFIAEKSAELTKTYGNVSSTTVGAIQRQLLVLENQKGEKFFGEPALDINDLMQKKGGKGVINLLAADKLMENPRLYATFLLFLLSELFEELPEVGDVDKPKLVFFFDEAHLLFDEAPKALLEKIEQVVRLIRSKGVGVYFVTQNPADVPETVLAQLGNRVQHALRACTPKEQKAVKVAAQSFRPNPKINTERVITEMGKGEALTSFLEGNGVPAMVDRTLIRPPAGNVGPVTDAQRKAVISKSPVLGTYDKAVDRESAFEMLQKKTDIKTRNAGEQADSDQQPSGGILGGFGDLVGGIFGTNRKRGERLSTGQKVAREVTRSTVNRIGGAVAGELGKKIGGSMGNTIGRAILRGALGGILRR